ncbi:MAG TPA: phage tail protein [Candidatus Sulfopaludibacter sp.]|nr:phage tail protein [Candidatus Sulfopaludibacter sp.]
MGFTISGGSLVDFTNLAGSGSTIDALTLDGVTFPANSGPGASNLTDSTGHQLWMGKWVGIDGVPLFVLVAAGAAGSAGAPASAPGWTLVMGSSNTVVPNTGAIQVFIYTPTIAGGGPCHSISPDGVVMDVCKRSGLVASQVDVSLLEVAGNIQPSTLVKGYVIERPTSGAEILKTLMQAYFFGGCESSGTMKFVPRGLASAFTIPEDDLGLVSDKTKIIEQFDQEQDLPQRFAVTYADPLYLYQQGKQEKLRNTRVVRTKQQSVINLPMVMDPDWARQVAEKTLFLSWLERQHFQLNLPRASYLLADPTDNFEFVYQGLTFTARIVENAIGQGFVIELKTVNENTNNYTSSAQGAGLITPNPVGGTPVVQPPSMMALFDIPLLQDTDANPAGTGKYVAFSSLTPTLWPGAQLFISSDDASYAPEGAADTTDAPFGYAVGVLGAPPRSPWIWDVVNTLTVSLASTTFSLSGDTEQNVLNGSNMLIVGQEIIQFVNAVRNMDGTWTVSKLLRGRRGTEWAAGFLGSSPTGTNTHADGELVAVVSAPGVPIGRSGVFRVADSLSILNTLRYYRGITLGADLTSATSQQLTLTGADRKPYAPVQISGSRDMSNNLTIAWIRRTRFGWINLSQDPVPLSEDSELYDVEIYSGASVVRTISGVTSPTASYTAAQQTTDFGSAQASVAVRVYQKSVEVGRGFAGAAAV